MLGTALGEALPQSVRYSAASYGGRTMTEIRKTNAICTQITAVKLPPGNQEQALNLMIERARFMPTQPGFVWSICTAARTAAI
jgi:hypothetical protein